MTTVFPSSAVDTAALPMTTLAVESWTFDVVVDDALLPMTTVPVPPFICVMVAPLPMATELATLVLAFTPAAKAFVPVAPSLL